MKPSIVLAARTICIFLKCVPFFCLLLLAVLPSCNDVDRASEIFTQKLSSHLSKPGEWSMVAELYPGEWTHVCISESTSTEEGVSKAFLREKFRIPPTSSLELPFGLARSTEHNWSITFFSPPNKLEMLAIETGQLRAVFYEKDWQDFGNCLTRNDAAVSRQQRTLGGKTWHELSFGRKASISALSRNPDCEPFAVDPNQIVQIAQTRLGKDNAASIELTSDIQPYFIRGTCKWSLKRKLSDAGFRLYDNSSFGKITEDSYDSSLTAHLDMRRSFFSIFSTELRLVMRFKDDELVSTRAFLFLHSL